MPPRKNFGYRNTSVWSPDHLKYGGWISALAFSPDGATLAFATADRALYFVDVFKQIPILSFDIELSVHVSALLWPVADRLFLGRSDGAVQVVKFDKAKKRAYVAEEVGAKPSLPQEVRRLAYSVESKQLAVAIGHCTYIHKPSFSYGTWSWELLDTVTAQSEEKGLVTALLFAPTKVGDWTLLIGHARDGVSLWISPGKYRRVKFGSSIGGACFAVDGTHLLVRNLEGRCDIVRIYDHSPWLLKKYSFLVDDPPLGDRNLCLNVALLDKETLITPSPYGNAVLARWRSVRKKEALEIAFLPINKLAYARDVAVARDHGVFAVVVGQEAEPGVVVLFSRSPERFEARVAEPAPFQVLSLLDLHKEYLARRTRNRILHMSGRLLLLLLIPYLLLHFPTPLAKDDPSPKALGRSSVRKHYDAARLGISNHSNTWITSSRDYLSGARNDSSPLEPV